MKTQLTAEQSANLISKGVCAYKASATHVGRWEHYSTGTFADPESVEPIFTLTDLLEILPKDIKVDGNRFRLRVEICPVDSEWTAGYVDWDNDPLHGAMDEELIVCLYHVALWCADNNYLNKE